ncbi:MAG: ECF transporter S component [Anaerolineae bacterium]|nr:ECF transporter S component [Anaerolineae bacterium]MDW8067592.1 ECF transporter S component [Anaerolineae bacterium]
MKRPIRQAISGAIYTVSSLLGVSAFLYPFFIVVSPQSPAQAHSNDAPLVTAALLGLLLMAMIVELQGQTLGAKMVALLGILTALNSVLRFIENAIPGPGGFSPVFAPIILTGYVFGGRFGFLMGVFSLLVSALITGGVGPWLPYQMFAAGWVGLTTGGLHLLRPLFGPYRHQKAEIALLCAWGFLWGLLYGAIMNLWFWPWAVGPPDQTWSAGLSLADGLRNYGKFYLVTSLAWDMGRAIGNVALILLIGPPTLRTLERFRQRFYFEVRPAHD